MDARYLECRMKLSAFGADHGGKLCKVGVKIAAARSHEGWHRKVKDVSLIWYVIVCISGCTCQSPIALPAS